MLKKLRNSVSFGRKPLVELKSAALNLKDNGKKERKPAVPTTTSTRFQSFLEARRISSRPITIIRGTDSDILHFKEESYDPEKYERDELMSIPVLPADEMDTLTSEIKVWKRNRRLFLIIFGLTQFFSLVALIIGILFTMWWFHEKGQYGLGLPGSNVLNVHTFTQLTNMWLLTMAALLFRLAPNTETKNIMIVHALLAMIAFVLYVIGIFFAVEFHAKILKANLNTFHSWLGAVTTFLFLIALLTGVCIACYPTRVFRALHAPTGTATLILCGTNVITGFYRRALKLLGKDYRTLNYAPSALVTVFGLVVLFQFILVRVALADFLFRRRPKPQWDVIVHRNLEAIEEAFFDVHNMYENFEIWIRQINTTRLRALRVPRMSICSSMSATSRADMDK